MSLSLHHDISNLRYQPTFVLPKVSNFKEIAFDFSNYTHDEYRSAHFLERDFNILTCEVTPLPPEEFEYDERNYLFSQSSSLSPKALPPWRVWMKNISENFEEINDKCSTLLAKDNGDKVSIEFKRIVKESVENNDINFFKWYVENVNVDSCLIDGNTILTHASYLGKRDIVKILLECGANVNHVNKKGLSALMFAAHEGHEDIVKMLLEANADINHPGADGFNALLWAAEKGRIESVKVLLNFGADIRYVGFDRSNALTCAIFRGHSDVVEILIEFGADISHIGGNGYTTLMLAIVHGHTEIVRKLIDARADVNHVREDGYTALTFALRSGSTEIVRMLIDAGADIEIRLKDGVNAFLLGSEATSKVIIEALVKKNNQESGLSNNNFIKPIWEDPYARIKLLGHSWEIDGNILWRGFETNLIGGFPRLFGHYMPVSLKKYFHDYPSELSIASQQFIINALEMLTEKSQYPTGILLDKFRKGLPVIIATGWDAHAVYVVFYNNYFAICNKGGGSIKPVELYQIDSTFVTADMFEKLESLKQKKESDFRELFGPDKVLSQSRTKSSLLEQIGCETPQKCVVDMLSPVVDRFDKKHPVQKVGNCAWESLEVAVHVLMGLTKLGEEGFNGATSSEEIARLESAIQRIFEGWEQFIQMEILEAFMANHQFDQNEKINVIENIIRNAPKLPYQKPFYERFVKVIDDVYYQSSLYQKLSFYWSTVIRELSFTRRATVSNDM